jgi:trigger factor
MVGEVARNKALAIILGKTEVVDSNGKKVDLTEFVALPGDEDADEDAAADDAAAEEPAAEEKPKKRAAKKKAE